MKNNNETKKLNNKGFSLVELIIVIAIMAVLIGVLAPQYLKYVEKSRQSADLDTVDAMISAVEIYSSDPANSIVSDSIKCAAGVVTADAQALAALTDAGITLPASPTKLMKSNAYQDWTITFSDAGLTFSTSDDGPALKTAMGR